MLNRFPAERSAVMCGASGNAPLTCPKLHEGDRLAVAHESPKTGLLQPALFDCAPARASAVKAPLCVCPRARALTGFPASDCGARPARYTARAGSSGRLVEITSLTSLPYAQQRTDLCGAHENDAGCCRPLARDGKSAEQIRAGRSSGGRSHGRRRKALFGAQRKQTRARQVTCMHDQPFTTRTLPRREAVSPPSPAAARRPANSSHDLGHS